MGSFREKHEFLKENVVKLSNFISAPDSVPIPVLVDVVIIAAPDGTTHLGLWFFLGWLH